MDTDEANPKTEPAPPSITKSKPLLPEVDLYIHLLVLIFAIDRQKNKQVAHRKFKFKIFLKFYNTRPLI